VSARERVSRVGFGLQTGQLSRVSVSKSSFRSHLGVGHEGYKSRSQTNYLEPFNILNIGLGKASDIQLVSPLLNLQAKKNKNRQEIAYARNSKKVNLIVAITIF